MNLYFVSDRKQQNTSFNGFGLTRSGIEDTTICTRAQHDDSYTTKAEVSVIAFIYLNFLSREFKKSY